MNTFSTTRATGVMLFIVLSFLLLSARVGYLQTHGRQQMISRAERQHYQNEILRARRGSVFDAHGNLLAGSVQTQSLFVDPKFMHERFQAGGRSLVQMDEVVEQLARLIDGDPFELTMLLSQRQDSRFIIIAERLDERACEEVRRLNIPGVGLTPVNVRYYPMGSIAAHVLGGTRRDGVGLEGLEFQFEDLLAGQDGRKRSRKDARRRPIAVAADDYLPPVHGQHLILTLDANIQMIVEQELARVCEEVQAEGGATVVMDPRSGEVLAMASWPSFNPQNIEDSTPDIRRNRALVDPYEPGSTLKPFIAAPGLAGRFTRVNEVFPINGPTYRRP